LIAGLLLANSVEKTQKESARFVICDEVMELGVMGVGDFAFQ
jgi:hypothetical protein